MCWLAAAMLTGASLLAGCLGPESKHCDNGAVCPADLACTESAVGCAAPERVESCAGRAPDAECVLATDGLGYCSDNVCTPCTADTAVCALPGWQVMSPAVDRELTDVWVAGRHHAFVVGRAGLFREWTGSSWISHDLATDQDFTAVWGTSATDVYLASADNGMYRYDGTELVRMSATFVVPLSRLWGTAARMYAVGLTSIYTLEAGAWKPLTSPVPFVLSGVVGRSSTDVFIVGSGSTFLHTTNGKDWSQVAGTPPGTFVAITDAGGTLAAISNNPPVLTRSVDGAAWSASESLAVAGPTTQLAEVWGSEASNLYVIGDHGTLLRFDGTSWSVRPFPSGPDIDKLSGIDGSAPDDILIVGGVHVFRYAGRD